MSTSERTRDYAAAIGLGLLALGIRAGLSPWLGSLQPFAPGFVAITAAVWFCGWRPAILTATLCYLVGAYVFVEPPAPGAWAPRDVAALVTYAVSAGLVIAIGHRARVAERRLAEANEQLRVADRKKDEFLAMLSHELRNPVGVISTAVAVLESSEHDARTGSTLGVISRQAAQIRRLIEDLLDVGRITRGRLTLQTAIVDIRTCVEHAAEVSQYKITGKGQHLSVALPSAPVPVRIDAARMNQVLTNLVDNASKYSPEGAVIRVSIDETEEHVRLCVADTGPGIDPGVLPHVFDLFDQGGVSASGGLGIGLGLCKRIVDMHGGSIVAGSNPDGCGAAFTITLPRVPSSARVPQAPIAVGKSL
jgi:signal transduction histidine kinase